jgi:hypothetical protein
VSDNSTDFGFGGGGILNYLGTVKVSDSTVSGNTANLGGGLRNYSGAVTVSNSTFSGNSAGYGGGGVYNSGTLTLTDSTLYGNSAGNGDGGGIDNLSGTATLINCTLDKNSASGRGGGIYNNAILNLTNTLIAFDTAPTGPDILNSGTIATASHNLIRIGDDGSNLVSPLTNGSNGNQVGTAGSPIDPKLDPRGLRNNGGPTQTIALEPGSPAINAGDDSVRATVPTDQRGRPRQSGPHVDIGAFEVQLPPPPPGGSRSGPRFGF